MKRYKRLCAGLGSALVFGAGAVRAQQAPPAPQQQQGFEATGQFPANYTPEEAAAVAVVKRWIDTTNTKDLAAHMALIDDNVIHRGDPAEALGHGARGYCAAYGFVRSNAWVRLDEMYVIGGPSDTLVLLKRTDINNPAGMEGNLGGYPVEVAVLARVRNGKITEWYDAPTIKIGPLVTSGANSRPPGGMRVPEACMKYPEPQAGQVQREGPAVLAPASPQVHPAAPAPSFGMLGYGVTKVESRFSPEEAAAAQTIRAWFAAWQAGNPLLLGAFADQKVDFRTTPASELVKGRDNLLRAVCGSIGGPLNLTDIYVIGSYWNTLAIARWNKVDAAGNRTRMASFFRVQNGLVTEWMGTQLAGTAPAAAANQNSPACQAVNTTLAAFAPAPAAAPAGAQPPRLVSQTVRSFRASHVVNSTIVEVSVCSGSLRLQCCC